MMRKILHIFMVLGWIGGVVAEAPPEPSLELKVLRTSWAELKYARAEAPDRRAAAAALAAQAATLAPTADSLLLKADVHCLMAEILHSSASLGEMGQAREALEQAEQLAPDNAQVQAALGSIYYELPGWPISFGSRTKAKAYLDRAIALDPSGRDSNYFMGDFLLQTGKPAEAIPFLDRALAVPQPGVSETADTGRRAEATEALDAARARLKRR